MSTITPDGETQIQDQASGQVSEPNHVQSFEESLSFMEKAFRDGVRNQLNGLQKQPDGPKNHSNVSNDYLMAGWVSYRKGDHSNE